MNRSFFRWAALGFTATTLALISAGALAQATFTLSDSNCSDFVLGGTPGARTLTCAVSAAPVCNVTGPAAATINQTITLTASCAPLATSFVWTGGACPASTTSTCQDTQTSVGTVTYTVKGTNAIGPGNVSPPSSVVWSNTPPVAPSGCTISGAPAGSQTAGYMATLALNCSGGGAPSAGGYVWTGTGAAGQTSQSVGPFAVNATTHFTATASNLGGTSNVASATVTIGGGGGGGPVSCSGYSTTLVDSLAWGSSQTYSSTLGAFGAQTALVVQFTTPALSTAPTSGKGTIGVSEYQGTVVPREGAISLSPCDFTVGLGQPGASGVFNGDTDPIVGFTVDYKKAGYIELQPSTTYFLNVITPSCTTGDCSVVITLTKPPGT